MPRDSPLALYAKNHAKIEFHYGAIAILYKCMINFITKLIIGIYLNLRYSGSP